MISIIIVNFRQKDLLSKCIHSIFNNIPNDKFELIIVNNSPEDEITEINKTFPGILLLSNSNTGYSKANNLAAQYAKGDLLLFLNADTIINEDFTGKLFNWVKDKKFGAAGLGLKFQDGRFQNSFGLFPSFFNEYRNRRTELAFRKNDLEVIRAREKEYSDIKEVDWVTGAAMIVKKDIFIKAGGFDEEFFLYYEDIDLCKRLNNLGYKNYYFPNSDITHHKGENTRGKMNENLKNIQNLSQIYYYKKHCSLLDILLLKIYRIIFK